MIATLYRCREAVVAIDEGDRKEVSYLERRIRSLPACQGEPSIGNLQKLEFLQPKWWNLDDSLQNMDSNLSLSKKKV